MPPSLCHVSFAGSYRPRVNLAVICVLLALCLPIVVVGQRDLAAMTRSMAAATELEVMADDVRREAMMEAARRGGTCDMNTAPAYTLSPPGLCTPDTFNATLYKSHKDRCSCKPRETVISLHEADTPSMPHPSMAVANRCSGWCSGVGHTCRATRTAPKAVPLFHRQVYHPLMCGDVLIEEDIECDCGCPLTAADCNDRQEFHAGACLCQCKKTEEFWRGCGAGRRWDRSQCRCVCETQKECSTGLGWSDDYCRCLRMMLPEGDRGFPSDDENSVRY